MADDHEDEPPRAEHRDWGEVVLLVSAGLVAFGPPLAAAGWAWTALHGSGVGLQLALSLLAVVVTLPLSFLLGVYWLTLWSGGSIEGVRRRR